MYGKLVVLFAVIALSHGDHAGYGAPLPAYAAAPAPEPIPPYAYNYAVNDAQSGNDFSAEEEAKNGVVVGQYKVLRADGIIMTVTYTVEGENGFVADIATEAAPGAGAGGAYGAPSASAYDAPLPTYA